MRGFDPLPPLPIERFSRPQAGRARPAWGEVERRLSEPRSRDLERLAERAGATLNNVVQAAWAMVLAKHSGADDIAFAATRACRRQGIGSEPDGGIGLWINTVSVRVNAAEDRRLFDLLSDLRAQWVAMRPHEQTPLSAILGWAGRGDQRGGGLRSLVVFERSEIRERLFQAAPQWRGWGCELREKTAFPLTVGAYGGASLRVTLGFHPEELEESGAQQLLHHLTATLTEMAQATPSTLVGDIAPPAHFHGHAGAMATIKPKPAPPNPLLHASFCHTAALFPNSVALIDPDRDRVMTYAQLDCASNQMAHALISRGLRPGDAVVVCQRRGFPLLVSLIGILKAGGAYVPVSPDDPDRRRAHILVETGASALLKSREIPDPAHPVPGVCSIDADSLDLAAFPADPPEVAIPADSPAYIIYTSGSTGLPKGVSVPHRAAAEHCPAIGRAYGYRADDRLLLFAAHTFDPFIEDVFAGLGCGASLVLRGDEIWSASRLHREARARGITVAQLPPAYLHECLAYWMESGAVSPTLRLALSGGDVLKPETVRLWQKLGAPFQLGNTYGPTETTITASLQWISPEIDTASLPFGIPIGTAVSNKTLYVRDARRRLLPPGIPGELWIGGTGHASGYVGHDGLTAERWKPDPQSPGGKMYRSGDRAILSPEGSICFLGRIDNQVKVRGFRIELGEIEAALESLSGVRQAAASVCVAGNLRAHVVLQPGVNLDPAELLTLLAAEVPPQMIPAALEICASLPQTESGKLDRKALARHFVAPTARCGRRPAKSPAEEQILAIFREILGLSDIGVTDDFFRLGGHSILALRLIQRINQQFSTDLPLAEISRRRTVEALTAALGIDRPASAPDFLFHLGGEGAQPPVFFIHGGDGGILFYHEALKHMVLDRRFYGIEAPMLTNPAMAEPASSLPDLARLYADRILGEGGTAPRIIGGYSFGGIAALEVARIIRTRGIKVPLVLLIDTPNPAIKSASRLNMIQRIKKRWRFGNGSAIARATRLIQRAASGSVESAKRIWRGQRAASLSRRGLAGEGDIRATQVNAAHARLLVAYEAKKYDGDVLLLRAQDQGDHWDPPEDLGWRKVAGGRLTITTIPGIHLEVFNQHNAPAVAAAIESGIKSVAGA